MDRTKIKELKELLSQFGDDEDVIIRIRPAMSDLEVGTITAERISFVALTYHAFTRPANRKPEIKR